MARQTAAKTKKPTREESEVLATVEESDEKMCALSPQRSSILLNRLLDSLRLPKAGPVNDDEYASATGEPYGFFSS